MFPVALALRISSGVVLSEKEFLDHLAIDLGNLALEITHAGFPGIRRNYFLD